MTECQGTCGYVARKDDPSNWHGEEPDDWLLDHEPPTGLEQEVWECPHSALAEREYCAFHTDPENLPDMVNEGELFVETINEASASDDNEVARQQKQFIGATFGPFNIEGATLKSGDEHPIRLDHASFTAGIHADEVVAEHGLFAHRTRVETDEGETVSFAGAEFSGDGVLSFAGAKFSGGGGLSFERAEFSGGGGLSFERAEFSEDGDLSFKNAEFNGTGGLSFRSAEFNGTGGLSFRSVEFSGYGDLSFAGTEFSGDGGLSFERAKFDGDSGLSFEYAEFSGNGDLSLRGAEFSGDGSLSFRSAKFSGAGGLLFAGAEFKGDGVLLFERAEFSGTGDLLFAGAEFSGAGDLRFSDAEFSGTGDLLFAGAEFGGSGDLSFRSAEFNGGGDFLFAGAEFSGTGDLRFSDTEFNGGVGLLFDASEFNGDAGLSFRGAEFNGNGDLSFRGTEFSGDGDIRFSDADFSGDGDLLFPGVEFSGDGDIRFSDAEHSGAGDLSFRGAEFSGDGVLSFAGAEFSGGGILSFEKAEISRECSFYCSQIKTGKEVRFAGAEVEELLTFEQGADESPRNVRADFDFSNAVFHDDLRFRSGEQSTAYQNEGDDERPQFALVFADAVDFRGATFEEAPDFSRTRFPADTDFTDTTLQNADFQNADVTGTDEVSTASFDSADLSGVNFSGANLTGASFERALLSRAELLGADLTRTKLYGALFGDARANRETTFWLRPDAPDRIPDDSRLPIRTLRAIKTRLREYSHRDGTEPYCVYDPRYRGEDRESDLDKAAETYGSIETLAHQNSLPGLASECFLGRKDVQLKKYWRDRNWLMITRATVPTVVARYGESPTRVLGTGAVTIIVCGLFYNAFNLIEHVETGETATLFESFYFSALTFTTLGYGDFNPVTDAGRVVAVAETSVGAIIIAILVFVFGRRATR